MAKKTDMFTGITTEVSDDEMMEALQSGQGIIKQIATMPDGSQQEVAIWGGYELDGFDRTLNVFMKHEDIGTFVSIITQNKIDPDKLVDPCELEEGVQVSVDFLDMPAMLIYRKGQGKLSTALYSRDERRTFRDTIETGTGEIELNEEGGLSLNEDTLKNNKFLVFAIAVLGVRRYLLKEGIVQKLYDMFDESAGVVVKVSKSGNISAKIVKGMERPDLPCQIFLFGEQICRPYIDELLGLKSTGIRKPRDPELAAKLKAAEEERIKKQEEEKRIAKEKAEAEAKAAKEKAEAEAKIEAEKKKKAMEEWKAKADSIRENREIEKEKRLKQYEDEYKSSVDRIKNKKDKDIEEAKQKIAELKQKVERDSAELDGLGLFKFGRKKELRISIESDNQTIRCVEDSIPSIESKATEDLSGAEKSYKKKIDGLESDLDREFVIPDSPEEIERKKKLAEEERIAREKAEAQKAETERRKKIVYDAVGFGETRTQIQNNISELDAVTVNLYLRKLEQEGKVYKMREGREILYYQN